MQVGNLEEFIDENHVIVSSNIGPEMYVSIMSFVDKDQLEPGSSILMNNRNHAVVGIMQEEVSKNFFMFIGRSPIECYEGREGPTGILWGYRRLGNADYRD